MRYLIFGFVMAAVMACTQPIKGKNGEVYKSAVQYNDYIITRQTALIKKVLDLSEVAQINLDSADRLLDKFVEQTDSMIVDIKGMPPYKSDSALRDAAVNSFRFYKRVFGNEYKQLIAIRQQGGDSTETGVAEMKGIVEKMGKEEEGYDKAFHNAQTNFATRNNIKLGENAMQKKIDNMK